MPGSRVLVVGDLNPDLVLSGDVVPRFGQAEQLLDTAEWTIGGSAGIVAHGLARLGRPVSLVAATGKDAFAARLCADLAAAGVDVTSIAARTDAPTGLTVVLCRDDDRAMLTLTGAVATLTPDEVIDALQSRDDLQHVHVASPFLVPLRGALPDVLAAARRHGRTVSLDTNDDPSGVWAGITDLLADIDVLLPNRREVLALGGGTDPVAAARRLAAHGPLVVVKLGAEGAVAVAGTGTPVAVASPPTTVRDTTGAGDTFDAAFLDALLAGRSLRTCLARAVHAGARAVTAAGGTSAQPTQHDLHDIGDDHDR